ncbi:MAG TPA: NADH-quinone oxidoreductase subunit J [Desulfobaccales bacterium]|nr:NADH-quinone oxidoreductase subunit J [Desulfobaccales bacterium]
MSIYGVIFYTLATIIIISTVLAITRRNLMHAIVYLVLSFIATAVLFYLLGAPFLAVLEVVIYAGVAMVGEKGTHIGEAKPVNLKSNLP